MSNDEPSSANRSEAELTDDNLPKQKSAASSLMAEGQNQ